MGRLGMLDEWLEATARGDAPAVAFSSCFPFVEDTRFVAPPRTLWPPTSPALLSARVRWKAARFVPLSAVETLLAGQSLNESQWTVDGPSECLLPAAQGGPFRTSLRWNAAVDRMSGAGDRHSTACTEFRPGAGLWTVASFSGDAAREKWLEPVKAAFRWLADAGFGGERSRGWGRSETPEFTEGTLPDLIVSPSQTRDNPPQSRDREGAEDSEPAERPFETPPTPPANGIRAHWLLSLFTPASADAVDWSRGNYTLLARAGRVDSSGELKKSLQMIAEGSVIYASESPRGGARDVAPEGFAHPVYRAGFAVSIPLPEAV